MEEKKTKLNKSLSPINVWALALGCIIGWGAFVMPGDNFLRHAGPVGTAIALGVASVLILIIAANYYYMINKFPVAGGVFTFAQRAFGRVSAFICGWFVCLSFLSIVPLNATALALVGRNLLGGIFQFGFHYAVAGYDVYLGEVILAVAALVLIAWLSIRGVKTAGVFQTALALALVLGVAVVALAALISPKTSWSDLQPAFNPDFSPIAGMLAVLAITPWAFLGFDTVTYAAEEFNFSPRKARRILVISVLFGGLVYIVLNTVTAVVVPDGFASWKEYIDASKSLHGIASLPTFNAARALLGPIGLVFLGIAVLAAILSGIIGFYMATSRLLYAMAEAHYVPQWFGRLHPRYKTPVNAILFIMIVSIIAPFFGRTALGWIVDISAVGASIGFGFTSAAALKYALQEKQKGVATTGLLGVLISVFFAVILLVPIPAFPGSLGRETYLCLGVWTLLGVLFFIGANKKFIGS